MTSRDFDGWNNYDEKPALGGGAPQNSEAGSVKMKESICL